MGAVACHQKPPIDCHGRFIWRIGSSQRKLVADFGNESAKCWSEWQDLSLRPPRPERGAPGIRLKIHPCQSCQRHC